MLKRGAWFAVLPFIAALLGENCAEHIEVGRDRVAASAAGNTSAGGNGNGGLMFEAGGSSAGTAGHACQVTQCQGKVFACGDCVDNDGDHLFDADDPDCTGPCDNTEDSYYGGIPGQNNAPCREDCYFDQDTGSGNDQCYWSQDCDPLSLAPGYPPSGDAHCSYNPGAMIPGSGSTCSGLGASQAAACLNYCLPITPNGCDCFGCCELPAESGKFVWIGSADKNVGTCDAAHVADTTACRPCTPVKSCFNACDPCKVCVGRSAPAPSCATPDKVRCIGGQRACGQPGEPECAAGEYCITGCCVPAPR